jgi:hypothetical protein
VEVNLDDGLSMESSYILYDVMCNAEQNSPSMWSKTDYAWLLVLDENKVVVNKQCTGLSQGILGVMLL